MRTTTPYASPLTTRVELKTCDNVSSARRTRRSHAHQVLGLNRARRLRAGRLRKAFLGFGLSRKTAVVDLQVRGRDQHEVRGRFIAHTLKQYDVSVGCAMDGARTIRTTSPLTRSAAGMELSAPSRMTRHEGGIIARNEARMASDFCSWYHSMNAFSTCATVSRLCAYWTRRTGDSNEDTA